MISQRDTNSSILTSSNQVSIPEYPSYFSTLLPQSLSYSPTRIGQSIDWDGTTSKTVTEGDVSIRSLDISQADIGILRSTVEDYLNDDQRKALQAVSYLRNPSRSKLLDKAFGGQNISADIAVQVLAKIVQSGNITAKELSRSVFFARILAAKPTDTISLHDMSNLIQHVWADRSHESSY